MTFNFSFSASLSHLSNYRYTRGERGREREREWTTDYRLPLRTTSVSLVQTTQLCSFTNDKWHKAVLDMLRAQKETRQIEPFSYGIWAKGKERRGNGWWNGCGLENGKMTQQLRALIALTEDLRLFPSSRWSEVWKRKWPPQASGIHAIHIHIYIQEHTHTHKNKNLRKRGGFVQSNKLEH